MTKLQLASRWIGMGRMAYMGVTKNQSYGYLMDFNIVEYNMIIRK